MRNKRSGVVKALIIAALLFALTAVLLTVFGGRIEKGVRRYFYPLKYTQMLKDAAARHGVDPTLVAAVTYAESNFDAGAVSRVGAQGLMQVMPETAEWIALRRGSEYRADSLFDPETNLDYGCWLLGYLLERYNGSVRNALIAYNAGHNRLDEWLETGANEKGELKDIPVSETRSYVEKVLNAQRVYGDIYEEELSNGS